MPQPIEGRVKPAELPALSPSSINLFIESKALWVLKHFYGLTSKMNIYADRGVVIEDAVNAFYSGKVMNIAEAQAMAVKAFQERAFFWGDEDLIDDIESKIAPWVEQAIKALASVSKDTLTLQTKVETEIAGLTVRGYVDYTFATLQTDLKTCNTLPSPVTKGPRKGMLPKDKAANVRQQSVYYQSTGLATSLLFVSHDGFYHHPLSEGETNAGMAEAEAACAEIKKLLEMDLDDVLAASVPNWKTMEYGFYWDEKLRVAAHDIWWNYAE